MGEEKQTLKPANPGLYKITKKYKQIRAAYTLAGLVTLFGIVGYGGVSGIKDEYSRNKIAITPGVAQYQLFEKEKENLLDLRSDYSSLIKETGKYQNTISNVTENIEALNGSVQTIDNQVSDLEEKIEIQKQTPDYIAFKQETAALNQKSENNKNIVSFGLLGLIVLRIFVPDITKAYQQEEIDNLNAPNS